MKQSEQSFRSLSSNEKDKKETAKKSDYFSISNKEDEKELRSNMQIIGSKINNFTPMNSYNDLLSKGLSKNHSQDLQKQSQISQFQDDSNKYQTATGIQWELIKIHETSVPLTLIQRIAQSSQKELQNQNQDWKQNFFVNNSSQKIQSLMNKQEKILEETPTKSILYSKKQIQIDKLQSDQRSSSLKKSTQTSQKKVYINEISNKKLNDDQILSNSSKKISQLSSQMSEQKQTGKIQSKKKHQDKTQSSERQSDRLLSDKKQKLSQSISNENTQNNIDNDNTKINSQSKRLTHNDQSQIKRSSSLNEETQSSYNKKDNYYNKGKSEVSIESINSLDKTILQQYNDVLSKNLSQSNKKNDTNTILNQEQLNYSNQNSIKKKNETPQKNNSNSNSIKKIDFKSNINLETSQKNNSNSNSIKKIDSKSNINMETSQKNNANSIKKMDSKSNINMETSQKNNTNSNSMKKIDSKSNINMEIQQKNNSNSNSVKKIDSKSNINMEIQQKNNSNSMKKMDSKSNINMETSQKNNTNSNSIQKIDSKSNINMETSQKNNANSNSIKKIDSNLNMETSQNILSSNEDKNIMKQDISQIQNSNKQEDQIITNNPKSKGSKSKQKDEMEIEPKLKNQFYVQENYFNEVKAEPTRRTRSVAKQLIDDENSKNSIIMQNVLSQTEKSQKISSKNSKVAKKIQSKAKENLSKLN